MGTPSIFVRVAGCNLACDWCDTRYAWEGDFEYVQMGVGKVLEEILRHDVGHVVITGGEPLLYRREIKKLCELIKSEGRFITVETNGTLFAGGINADLISLSPKLPSAGQPGCIKPDVLRKFLKNYRCQLKFVIDDERDLSECVELLQKLSAYEFEGPILQPNGMAGTITEYRARLKRLVRLALLDDNRHSEFFRRYKCSRVLPQLHVLLYGNRRGV